MSTSLAIPLPAIRKHQQTARSGILATFVPFIRPFIDTMSRASFTATPISATFFSGTECRRRQLPACMYSIPTTPVTSAAMRRPCSTSNCTTSSCWFVSIKPKTAGRPASSRRNRGRRRAHPPASRGVPVEARRRRGTLRRSLGGRMDRNLALEVVRVTEAAALAASATRPASDNADCAPPRCELFRRELDPGPGRYG